MGPDEDFYKAAKEAKEGRSSVTNNQSAKGEVRRKVQISGVKFWSGVYFVQDRPLTKTVFSLKHNKHLLSC
jgi:hypothetical protein